MAELNDKLITYGNLSTFYDKLQEQGLGGDAIEDASVLPDAGENKSKLIRLESDDNVYISELKSRTSTTTNRLPDAQQIDKAYMTADEYDFWYYKGEAKLICTDGEIVGYGWKLEGAESDAIGFTLDNIINISTGSYIYMADVNAEPSEGWSISGNTGTTSLLSVSDVESRLQETTVSDFEFSIGVATYNAPEANQIGNAYFNDGTIYYYTGIEKTLVCSDGSLNLYEWKNDNDIWHYFTEQQASDLIIAYGNEGVQRGNFKVGSINVENGWQISGNTYTNLNESIDNILDGFSAYSFEAYIPQLNAPDSEQVDNAYIDEFFIESRCLYKGVETTIAVDGNILTVYSWENDDYGINCYSTKRASEIYNIDTDSDDVHFYEEDGGTIFEISFSNGYLTAISTVKYQRIQVTQEWDWEQVPTKDYVDDAIDNIPQYTAGEGIAISSANTISCTVKPIADVSVLPDAEENKDSVLRLEGDKNVYIAKTKYDASVNSPDFEQIGVAYISDDAHDKLYYQGTEVTIIKGAETYTGYYWDYEGGSLSGIDTASRFSVLKAEEIQNDNVLFYNGELRYVDGTTFIAIDQFETKPMHNLWDLSEGYYIKKGGYIYNWQRVLTEDELDSIGDAFQALEARIYALEHPTTIE